MSDYEKFLKLLDQKASRISLTLFDDLMASGFDGLKDDEKRDVLKKSLRLVDGRCAEKISERMGCSIKTLEGIREVIPLIDETENPLWVSQFIKRGFFHSKEETRFGRFLGLKTLSRLMRGCSVVEFTRRRKKVRFKGGNWEPFWVEDVCLQKDGSCLDLFDVLISQSDNGRFFVQEEREEISGLPPLNKMLHHTLPGDSLEFMGEHRYQGDYKEALVQACQQEPGKIRTAVEACLFKSNGELDEQSIKRNFWKFDGDAEGWIFHFDVLVQNKILQAEESQHLLKILMDPNVPDPESALAWTGYAVLFQLQKLEPLCDEVCKAGNFSLEIWKDYIPNAMSQRVGKSGLFRMITKHEQNEALSRLDNIDAKIEGSLLRAAVGEENKTIKRVNKI